MNEVFSMWKKMKMVVLAVLCAALYAALLIPFKGFVLIQGITEFRPASALPVAMGLLFGPAGAWGAAIGNLVGDFFGSLSAGSLFGFVGNFMFAYVPYKLWINLGLVAKPDREPDLKSKRKIAAFVIVAVLGSLACALVIAWGLDVLRMVPFAALGSIIFLNNSIPAIVLGIPMMIVLYPRIKGWNLLWTDIMNAEDIPAAGGMSGIGGILMTVSILVGMIGGFIMASAAGQAFLYRGFGAGGEVGSFGVLLVAGMGTAGLVLSCFIQSMPVKK